LPNIRTYYVNRKVLRFCSAGFLTLNAYSTILRVVIKYVSVDTT